MSAQENKVNISTFTTIANRPDAAHFGVGRCTILDTGVTYESDGITWTPYKSNELLWSNKPSASAHGKGQAWFSDIGSMGYSDGTNWNIGFGSAIAPEGVNSIYTNDTSWTGWTSSNASLTKTAGVLAITCTTVSFSATKLITIPQNKAKVWFRARVTAGSLLGWRISTNFASTYPVVDLQFPDLNKWVDFEVDFSSYASALTRVGFTQTTTYDDVGNTLEIAGLTIGEFDYSSRNLTNNGIMAANQSYALIRKTVGATGADYTTIAAAIAGCDGVGPHKRYELMIQPGTYAEQDLVLLDYIYLTGVDRETCIIQGYQAPSSSNTQIAASSPLNVYCNTRISNLTITAQNMRYCIHCDGTPMFDKTVELRNCLLEHYGNDEARADPAHSGDSGSTWASEFAWGSGTKQGAFFYFENCEFRGIVGAFSVHNYRNFTKQSKVYLKNCKLIATKETASSLRIQSLGSTVKDKITLENCELNSFVQHNDSGWLGGSPASRIEWQLTAINCTPFRYDVSTSVAGDANTRPVIYNVEKELYNTSGVTIPRGSAVVYNTAITNIRAMTSTDLPHKFIGITLEDIASTVKGRVSSSGIDTSTFIAREDATAVALGTTLGISSVTPGQFKVGNIPAIAHGIGSEIIRYAPIVVKPSASVLVDDATGYIVPSLVSANAATYSQTTTTVTVTSTAHNIPATIHNGKNVYLAIGTVSTGVAPTGYTTGWFSNFQYVDANTFTCTATNSQTGTGFVNTTTTAIALPLTGTVPAGLLGVNGSVVLEAYTSHNNSAGAKTLRALFGGTIWSNTAGTTTLTSYVLKALRNRGDVAKQITPAGGSYTGAASSVANNYLTINTASDVALTFTLQSATASDYVALDAINLTARI